MDSVYHMRLTKANTICDISAEDYCDEGVHLYDTVTAIVIATTRKGVILQFGNSQQGYAYGSYTIGTRVLASVQKMRVGLSPRLSVDSVIYYPEYAA